jgi:glycosyltransferase involved in cell wall biosynthesis
MSKVKPIRFVIDCGEGGPNYPWGPSSIHDGIGGSEECVIYLAEALFKQGNIVTVINNCGEENTWWYQQQKDAGYDFHTIKNEPRLDYVNAREPEEFLRPIRGFADVYVSWRNMQRAITVKEQFPDVHVWLWCHDIPVGDHWNFYEPKRDIIDRVVLLNDYHASLYNTPKAFVCPIGVNLADWTSIENEIGFSEIGRVPGLCLYFSHPHRGLHDLRRIWPDIRREVPYAKLQAFWWEPEHFLPTDMENGILPMRSASHKELARYTLMAELFTYPSCFDPEISPATTIKAQIGGCIPITINKGGMVETVKFGEQRPNLESFKEAVINHLTDNGDPLEIQGYREAMMKATRAKYNWDTVASNWERRAMEDMGL